MAIKKQERDRTCLSLRKQIQLVHALQHLLQEFRRNTSFWLAAYECWDVNTIEAAYWPTTISLPWSVFHVHQEVIFNHVSPVLSMGSKTPKPFRYSGRSKPRTTDRRVPPVEGRLPSEGNVNPKLSGYSERSDPRTKYRQATEEGQTHPHRWQMTVSNKR